MRSAPRKFSPSCKRCTSSIRSRATGRVPGCAGVRSSAYRFLLRRTETMLDAYLYDGLRSPIGRHAGKLAGLRPDDLAGEVIKEVVTRNKIDPAQISDVVLGCVNQAGEDNRNVARFAALLAGLPATTPGCTVNRLCASGLQAVVDASRAITCGEGDLYIAGGVERDRKSTRLNSSHPSISYAVFCLKKKKKDNQQSTRTHQFQAST